MDILELQNTICNALAAKGYNSTIDPYFNFKECLEKKDPEPVIIVESGDNSDFTFSANSTPYKAEYMISVTAMVYADQRRPYSEFKPAAIALGKTVLKEITSLSLMSLGLKIKSLKQKDGEFMVDGVKVSGVTFDLKIEAPVSF